MPARAVARLPDAGTLLFHRRGAGSTVGRAVCGSRRVVEGGAERLGRPGLESVAFRLSAVLGAGGDPRPMRPWMGAGGGERGSVCQRRARRGTPFPPSRSWERGGARVAVWRGVPRDWGDPVSKASPSASLRFSVRGETPGRCVLGWARAAVREGVCASDVPVAGLSVSPSRSRERNAARRAAVSVCRRRPRSGACTGVGGRGETLAAVGSRSVVPRVRSGGVQASRGLSVVAPKVMGRRDGLEAIRERSMRVGRWRAQSNLSR